MALPTPTEWSAAGKWTSMKSRYFYPYGEEIRLAMLERFAAVGDTLSPTLKPWNIPLTVPHPAVEFVAPSVRNLIVATVSLLNNDPFIANFADQTQADGNDSFTGFDSVPTWTAAAMTVITGALPQINPGREGRFLLGDTMTWIYNRINLLRWAIGPAISETNFTLIQTLKTAIASAADTVPFATVYASAVVLWDAAAETNTTGSWSQTATTIRKTEASNIRTVKLDRRNTKANFNSFTTDFKWDADMYSLIDEVSNFLDHDDGLVNLPAEAVWTEDKIALIDRKLGLQASSFSLFGVYEPLEVMTAPKFGVLFPSVGSSILEGWTPPGTGGTTLAVFRYDVTDGFKFID